MKEGVGNDDDDSDDEDDDEDGHGYDDTCQVTMKEGGSTEDKFIRNLHKGDFFGEKALSGEEVALIKENTVRTMIIANCPNNISNMTGLLSYV